MENFSSFPIFMNITTSICNFTAKITNNQQNKVKNRDLASKSL